MREKEKEKHISIRPVGIVRAPFLSRKDAPKQGFKNGDVSCIDIYEEYQRGIAGIQVGDILDLIYWMDRSDREKLWNDRKKRGIFATRGPDRPNPIGISPVQVVGIEGNTLTVLYSDALDGSIVVDVKHSLFSSFDDLKDKEF